MSTKIKKLLNLAQLCAITCINDSEKSVCKLERSILSAFLTTFKASQEKILKYHKSFDKSITLGNHKIVKEICSIPVKRNKFIIPRGEKNYIRMTRLEHT